VKVQLKIFNILHALDSDLMTVQFHRPSIMAQNILLLSVLTLHHANLVTAADKCQPATWCRTLDDSVFTMNRIVYNLSESVANIGSVQTGQISCRDWAETGEQVNYYTCTQIANERGIDLEVFFELNPDVARDCGNVRPHTKYCTAGCMIILLFTWPRFALTLTVVEPLRAVDGRCGPLNQNATCLGTGRQCCNS